jgi:NAD dependent epimerase/dehydratase family enzyme
MARETLLASQRALPDALAATGFDFRHPTLEGALRSVLA